MEVKSPIANFIEVLKQVDKAAQTHSAKLQINETATRSALIDPILKALGWDATNPDMVEFEKTYQKNRVDYALMDCFGNVIIVIEAKALGGDLSNPAVAAQIINYGVSFKLQNIILTDGIIWHHYSSVTLGSAGFETIDISANDPISCADFFIKWLDASRYWTQSASQKVPATSPVVPTNISGTKPVSGSMSIQSPTFQPLSSLPINLKGFQKPKLLRLPNGQVIPIHHWRDVLAECVKFTLQNNPSLPVPLRDKAGLSISLLDNVKTPKNVTIMQTTYNGKTIFVHLNYDSKNCVANAIYILGFLPKGQTWPMPEVSF